MTMHSLADTQATTSTEHETIGGRLRRLRKATGCTIGEIAAAAGISVLCLETIERGSEWPTRSMRHALARVYDASLDDLAAAGPGGRSSER